MEKMKKGPAIFYTFYFVIFLEGAIRGSFLNLYLSDSGMSSSTIGLINGIIQIISLFTYPIWGYAADRAATKNKVLITGLMAALILMIGFYLSTSLMMLGIMMILFSIVNNPLHGIYETITIEHVIKSNWNYSPIRMCGTIGYAIMSLVAGLYISKQKALLFPFFIAALVLTIICAFFLPRTSFRERPSMSRGAKEERYGAVYSLLKKPNVRRVLILYGVYCMTNAFNSTYFGIYMSSMGGGYEMTGIANTVMALAEIPFHVGPGRRWMKRIGVEKCLLIVMAFGVVRWTICALSQNVWLLVVTMAFNGIMLVPTIVGVVEFLFENAPDHLKASAQTALRSPFQVGGQLIANIAGGFIVGALDAVGVPGIRVLYACLAPICMTAGLVIGIPMIREDRRQRAAK